MLYNNLGIVYKDSGEQVRAYSTGPKISKYLSLGSKISDLYKQTTAIATFRKA